MTRTITALAAGLAALAMHAPASADDRLDDEEVNPVLVRAPAPVAPTLERATASTTSTAEVAFEPDEDSEPFKFMYHGFRLGYTYVNGIEVGGDSPVKSPHMFVLGYS